MWGACGISVPCENGTQRLEKKEGNRPVFVPLAVGPGEVQSILTGVREVPQ